MGYFKVLKEDLWRAIILPIIRNSFFAYYFAPFFNLLESMQLTPARNLSASFSAHHFQSVWDLSIACGVFVASRWNIYKNMNLLCPWLYVQWLKLCWPTRINILPISISLWSYYHINSGILQSGNSDIAGGEFSTLLVASGLRWYFAHWPARRRFLQLKADF